MLTYIYRALFNVCITKLLSLVVRVGDRSVKAGVTTEKTVRVATTGEVGGGGSLTSHLNAGDQLLGHSWVTSVTFTTQS